MFGPHKSGRPLTVRERALAQSVFGSALDYHSIRIHNRSYFWFQSRRVTMAPNGHLWFHPKGDMFCDDFCDARSQTHYVSTRSGLMRVGQMRDNYRLFDRIAWQLL
jgi:hypothetical protein